MKTHIDTRRPHLDFYFCLHSSLGHTLTPPWLPTLLTFFTGFLLHWRNKPGQPGSLYSSPCSGLTLHQPSPGVLSSAPNMLSAPQTHLAASWQSLHTFSLLWWQRSSQTTYSPYRDRQFSVKASSEAGSVPSEPFPASHQHQTEPAPSVLPGLFPQVRNAHAFL